MRKRLGVLASRHFLAGIGLLFGFVASVGAELAQAQSSQGADVGNVTDFIRLKMNLAGKSVACEADGNYYFNGCGNVFFDEEIVFIKTENVIANTANKLSLTFPPSGTRTYKKNVEVEKKYCSVSSGYGAFLNRRHQNVRENVCGNDPATACMIALERLCGIGASMACADKHRSELNKISVSPR